MGTATSGILSGVAMRRRRAAFTLIELLVVIAIIGLLVAILVPSLAKAKDLARQATCMTRIDGQLLAVQMYAAEWNGNIPTGPAFYNTVATNQIWFGSGGGGGPPSPVHTYNGQGVLLEKYLNDPRAFFCPDDNIADSKEELKKVGGDEDAYSSYLYRQLDGRRDGHESKRKLEDLGRNNAGVRVRALVMDMNSELTNTPEGYPAKRCNHDGERVGIGFADGNVSMFDDPQRKLTLFGDMYQQAQLMENLDRLFEYADELGR